MVYFLRKLQATVAFIISFITISSIAYADDVITFAEADTITGESLINLIAFERAKARGVKAEAISLQSDDLVFQAVFRFLIGHLADGSHTHHAHPPGT